MAVIPHTIDVVVADMATSLSFYRTLGLDAPVLFNDESQVQVTTLRGATIGLLLESAMREHNPDWPTPVGQRVSFACSCESPAEVDEVYSRVTEAGFVGLKAPWDSFWGQRYAMLSDPDGNRVDLFAASTKLGEE